MRLGKESSLLDESIRIIIRDPLGFKTGIMIDNVSCHTIPSDHSVQIYGMLYATDSSTTNPIEAEIYYYFLDSSDNVIYAGSGEHFGSFSANLFAPFKIVFTEDLPRQIWNEAKSIIIFTAHRV